MISRLIEDKLMEMATKFPVIAVTGPRQSGKTTLCKELFGDYKYVTLENPDHRQYALTDPKGFLAEYNDKVIIDEVQNAPELFSYIQGIVDESGKTGQYILSGSQNFLLLDKISQTLAGRVYIYHLLPFSYLEVKNDYPQNLKSIMYKGGFPRIYDKEIQPEDFFPSYIQTYLERDVRSILNVKDLSAFSAFITICAGRVGQIFNASNIANEIGVNYKTIQEWVSLLETSFIIYRLQPWHTNFNKRVVKSPKLYFYDTGLACHLLGLRKQEEIEVHFAKGALFENYCITEFIKNQWNKGNSGMPYFWRDSAGSEVDLLIDYGQNISIAEIKSAKTIRSEFFKGLSKFEKLATNFSVSKYLIYGGDESQNRTGLTILAWNDLEHFHL